MTEQVHDYDAIVSVVQLYVDGASKETLASSKRRFMSQA